MSAAIAGKARRPYAHVVSRHLFIGQFYSIGLSEAVTPE
jgi:hypothetical protein